MDREISFPLLGFLATGFYYCIISAYFPVIIFKEKISYSKSATKYPLVSGAFFIFYSHFFVQYFIHFVFYWDFSAALMWMVSEFVLILSTLYTSVFTVIFLLFKFRIMDADKIDLDGREE